MGAALLTCAATAQAQTITPPSPDTAITITQPMMDQVCPADPYAGASYMPPCSSPVSRKVTVLSETQTLLYASPDYGYGYGSYKVIKHDRNYHVDYSGNLKTAGIPKGSAYYYTPEGYLQPVFNLYPEIGIVNADLSYDATGSVTSFGYDFYRTDPDPSLATGFATVSNMVARVNSINVDTTNLTSYDAVNDIDYSVDLTTADPTAVTNNSVAFSGKFHGTGDKIVFGTISGTATARFGSGADSYLYSDPALYGGTQYASLAQLDVQVSAQATTVLDETGLLTPRVEVTDGIQMNGSRISGLADGVNPDDAVNKGQLDAAIARVVVIDNGASNAASSASGTGSMAGGSGSQASGNGAVAFGTGNQATGNGAVAIGDPNLATGTGAVAIGADNTATGDGAVAIGNLAVANGTGNVALGNGAQANAANSVALGGGSVANRANTVSVGATGAERQVTNVAAGTADTDAVNVGQFNTEVAARTAADLAINQRIAIEESNRAALGAALTSETNARAAADLALSNRIDLVGTRLDKLQSQVDLLDKHIASSTAVAVAMSGNAFLPDMKFNLTANVGTYDGAHAGSIQIGALVSRHVAINAGVATGFNKGGKTAGRVGMTFGW